MAVQGEAFPSVFAKEIVIQMRNVNPDLYGKLLLLYVCLHLFELLLFFGTNSLFCFCAVKNVQTKRSLDASACRSEAKTIVYFLIQPHLPRLHSQQQQLHLVFQQLSRLQIRLLLLQPLFLLLSQLQNLLFKSLSVVVVVLRILCLNVMATVTMIRNVKVTCNVSKGMSIEHILLPVISIIIMLRVVCMHKHCLIICVSCLFLFSYFISNFVFPGKARRKCLGV